MAGVQYDYLILGEDYFLTDHSSGQQRTDVSAGRDKHSADDGSTQQTTSFSELILAGKYEDVLEYLSPYLGFVVDSRGKDLELATTKKMLETAEDGRSDDAFNLLLKAQSVPDLVLKLALEVGPPVEKYLGVILNTFKSLKQKTHYQRLEMILDCLDEIPADAQEILQKIKGECTPDYACSNTRLNPHQRLAYERRRTQNQGTSFGVDSCSVFLISYQPRTLKDLATHERWHAVLNRIRNGLVKIDTSKEALEVVYDIAGKTRKFGVQLELAHFFPEVFAPQPAARRADLELLSSAMTRVFLDGHDTFNRQLKADVLGAVKKITEGQQASVHGEVKVLESRVESFLQLHKTSLEMIHKLEKEAERAETFRQTTQDQLQTACDRITTLETRLEAMRAEFRAGANGIEGSGSSAGTVEEQSSQKQGQQVDAVVAEFLHQVIADNQAAMEQRLEKQKSSMIGYIDGKVEGQVSLLVAKIAALERDVSRLSRRMNGNIDSS